MLKKGCIHPQLMAALARMGHGDQLLIADGNYPLAQKTGEAEKVYLGLVSGCPTVPQVLDALLEEVNLEAAWVMDPGTGEEPEIFADFRKRLPGIPLEKLGRQAFYEAASAKTVVLAISTGEKRTFANLLLTLGVA